MGRQIVRMFYTFSLWRSLSHEYMSVIWRDDSWHFSISSKSWCSLLPQSKNRSLLYDYSIVAIARIDKSVRIFSMFYYQTSSLMQSFSWPHMMSGNTRMFKAVSSELSHSFFDRNKVITCLWIMTFNSILFKLTKFPNHTREP